MVTALRLLFFPLFILSVLPQDKPLFDNDLWYYSFMILFAFSNGFFGSTCRFLLPRLWLLSRFLRYPL